jgi:acetylornithine deacetylase/succinyl-diaminopimelate desuccinylase-like protein
MLTLAGRLAELNGKVSERLTTFHIEPEAARRSVMLLGGELSGGHNFNVVPDRVSFTVDRRPNPEEDFDVERDTLLQVIEQARADGVECEVDVFQEGRSAWTDPNGALGRALSASIEGVTGKAARFELCPGVLETRHYAALGVPALAYGPGLLSVSHGPNEFVSIEKLLECAEVYALTAARLLS